MRYAHVISLLLLSGALSAAAGSAYTIHEECERFGNSDSATYDGTTRQARMTSLTITAVNYRFDIRASAMAPSTAQAEWVVLTKEGTRRPEQCARGTASLTFSKNNRRTSIQTGRIQIPSSTEGSRDYGVYGYGIRLTDDQGRVLEEKYSPAGAKSAIAWTPSANTPPAAPPRPTVPMPVVF